MECPKCRGVGHVECPCCDGRGIKPYPFTCPVCGRSWPRTYRVGRREGDVYVWETCEDWGKPVKHHWVDIDGCRHEVLICSGCNSILSSNCPIALGDHVFPSWEVQVDYVRRRLGEQKERSKQLNVKVCEKELSLLRSWLGREHTAREIQGFGMSEEELIEMVKHCVKELGG